MKTPRRFLSFVPAAAVAAVTVAALGAAWLAPSQPVRVAADRPSLQDPAPAMVKAPPLDGQRQAVACRDCQPPAAPAGRY
jgi:hypothetical protein